MFGVLALTALMTSPAAADKTDYSANHYLPACRLFAHPDPVMRDVFRQGECLGIVETLVQVATFMPSDLQSCLPDGVSNNQVVTVVVRWLEQHPQRWNENFLLLTQEALHEAWPCK